jgi:hypothetical protein
VQSRKCEGRIMRRVPAAERHSKKRRAVRTGRPPRERPHPPMRRDVGWSWPEYGRGSTVRGTFTPIGVHRLVWGKPFSTPDLMIVRAPYVPVPPKCYRPGQTNGPAAAAFASDNSCSRRPSLAEGFFSRPQPHKKRQPLGPEIVKGRPSSRLLFRYFCTGGASGE